jgi:hypothetical protein
MQGLLASSACFYYKKMEVTNYNRSFLRHGCRVAASSNKENAPDVFSARNFLLCKHSKKSRAPKTQVILGIPGGFAAWNAVLTSSST